MKWWDDLWLNEGFATYMEYVGTNHVHPEWNIFDEFTIGELFDAFEFDGLKSSHPVYVPVNNPDEIGEIFDKISYAKDYLTKLSYQNAFHDDLWNALQARSVKDGKQLPFTVKEIMDTWINQINYPVVMVTRTPSGLHLSQRRFLINKDSTDEEKYPPCCNYIWKIPFSYTTSKTMKRNAVENIIWFDSADKDIQDSTLPDTGDSWILGNVQQYGFYRVNYDNENWKALIQQLKNNHEKISVINRAQIINDVWNLGKAGETDMENAFEAVEYLNAEMNRVPWVTAARELSYLDDMLAKTAYYDDFKVWYDILLSTQFIFFVDPNIKGSVYCTGIGKGGQDEWDFAYSQYKQTQVASEKGILLTALGCTGEIGLLNHYLQLTLDANEIRTQDIVAVITSLKQFVEDHPDLGTGERAFKQAIENTETNIKWMNNNLDLIKSWLQKVVYPNDVTINVRLPRSVLPQHYDLELKPDIYGNEPESFRFYGHSSLASQKVVGLKFDTHREFVIFILDSDLQSGSVYYLSFDFSGPLKEDLHGFTLVRIQEEEKQGKYMATSDFEPNDARKAFPCFDEPDIKASYNITILRKPNKISLSNMPKRMEQNRSDGYIADVYEETKKLSTYLVAFIVCDFDRDSIWARSDYINQTTLALNASLYILTFFEDYLRFHIRYQNKMFRFAVVVAIFAVVYSTPIFSSELDSEWVAFKNEHKKEYGVTEELQRRLIWENNVNYIQKHNLEADRGVHTFWLGMNEYGDMTSEEFVRVMNGYIMSNKTSEGNLYMPPSHVSDLPDNVDWRTKGYVTEVKNQETMVAKENGKCKFSAANVGATDTGYTDLKHGSEDDLQSAVATVGPISVAMDAGHPSFQLYKRGVYSERKCSSKKLDHGVLAVGYGSGAQGDYWIVKNSWGKTWGMEGYFELARNKNNMCGIATQASYPTGPNFLWHIDGYDKLKPYAIAIHGCIDGFSQHIIWLQAKNTNKDPRVVARYYIDAIEHANGNPMKIRAD
ncbi:hypothetical protein KUTeg_010702 [Tegillarca granosa]|uniref:Uncharacterized protein n=1 Tax=Tegillarca granosa TaxID=220873 RepID=A0ABQ9F1S9_TEGGR|nr:hypothetical protein KUTeg_010702 [Tegillarca granosa]